MCHYKNSVDTMQQFSTFSHKNSRRRHEDKVTVKLFYGAKYSGQLTYDPLNKRLKFVCPRSPVRNALSRNFGRLFLLWTFVLMIGEIKKQ